MKYRIEERDYLLAIDRALEVIEDKAGSCGSQILEKFLGSVWDSIVSADLGDLQALDRRNQELVLDLIIGRLQYGRPIDHLSRDRLLRISIEQFSKQKATAKRG